MARSCGLRIGPGRFELVVLDGSARKHKIAAWMADEFSSETGDPVLDAIETLREAVRTHNVPKENVGIAIDTGLAAFRAMKLPFGDRSKIEQVLKFEVESQLPQWNIDDVIIDFLTLDSNEDESELLITAVQKSDLERSLDICVRSGFDPLEAELETSAMVNAACMADVCHEDDAQVLVHIGEQTTSLVVMDAGKVVEMRAIHIGAMTSEQSARKRPLEEESDDEDSAEETLTVADPLEIQRRLDQAVKRIRREIGRSVSAARTRNDIDSIFICGMELPGLVGNPILDVPVYLLDVFEEDSGQPAEGFGSLVVPYGVAVRQLGGGVLKPSLRREELRYTGTFEKIELPLAVVCLLVVTLLGVHSIFLFKQTQWVDDALAFWRDSSMNHLVGSAKTQEPGNLLYPSEGITKYVDRLRTKEDPNQRHADDPLRDRFQQLTQVKSLLQKEIKQLEEDLGQGSEIVQPQSAFKALNNVIQVMSEAGPSIGRPSLRKVQATYKQGKRGAEDSVDVVMDITFFAENTIDATEHFENFVEKLRQQPWYESHEDRTTKTIEDGKGISVTGFPVTLNLMKGKEKAEADS